MNIAMTVLTEVAKSDSLSWPDAFAIVGVMFGVGFIFWVLTKFL